MSEIATAQSAWIVVEVRSGIPAAVKTFSSQELAEKYSEMLRNDLNLDNDETGIFQVNLEASV